jgi:hypothetical protein
MPLNINSYTHHHRLQLKLKPIMVGELHLARKLTHPVYIFHDGIFTPVIDQGSIPTKDQITQLIKSSYREVFVYGTDEEEIKGNLENALIKITRSLSIGDPIENGTKGMKLLTLNLNNLYQNPHNDKLLMLQFQSSQNLGKFLIDQKKHQSQFYSNINQENFHYTLTQPLLSSVLLLSFLQATHLFHDKEIQNLFLTSYFKDIGLSMIPNHKYELKNLPESDRDLFANHSDFSFDLLDGRIPLAKNYLNLIKHHHFLNDKMKAIISGESHSLSDSDMILGLESTLVAVFDIIVAMTHERPYRRSLSLYQSLEVIKKMMADDYPQEFKALISFLRQFFKN